MSKKTDHSPSVTPAAVKKLRDRVTELEEILYAIKAGQVDALVIRNPSGEENVFTLQGAEHPYRVLIETMDVGAATVDSRGAILYANARFADMIGVPLEKLIGSHICRHVPQDQRQKLHDLVEKGMEEPQTGNLELTSGEGRRRLLRLAICPLSLTGIQTVCLGATEVTEIVEANEALQMNERSLRQLSARLLQLQDDERRRIARDLHDATGQKLVVLAMTLGQLKKKIEASGEQAAATVADCIDVTNQIVSEIRTVSYLLHPPLLDELGLSSAVHWFTQGFEKRTRIRVKVDIPQDLARLPLDSEVALFRVIQESLGNVHRHSGSKTATIAVRAGASDVTLEIRDRGKGISAEALRTPGRGFASLGVGIQGMRERMRQLSGTLEVVSKLGVGTTIVATVPIVAPTHAAASDLAENVAMVPPQPEENGSGPNDGHSCKRILIADDHEVMRRGLRAMLQDNSEWEICGEAVNGKEAVEKVAELRADLVILDINMPELNGLAAVRRILRSGSRTKILMFSVHDSDQTIREIREAGAHGYVSKSNAGQDLVQAIRAILDGRSFYPELAANASSGTA